VTRPKIETPHKLVYARVMRIDRNRFLLFTASLSAAACASGTPSAIPAEPVIAEAPEEPAEETPGEESPSVAVAEADAGPASPVTEAGSPVSEWGGGAPSPPTTLATDKKCNDNVGKPGACTFKAPGPQCESFSGIGNECKSIVKAFKPKVAERAVDCMKQKSGTPAICEFALASRCASEAIRNGVCPDKTADVECQKAVTKCSSGRGGSPLTMDECRAAYSAVQTKSRKKMMSCVSEFCSIDNCLYQL
jgi:hypothetical protein